MYFKKYKCPVCGTEYDSMDPACPKCHDENTINPKAAKRPLVQHAWWVRQIILFVVGCYGFQLMASVLATLISNSSIEKVQKIAIINFGSYALLFVSLGLILWNDSKKILLSFKAKKAIGFGFLGLVAIYYFSILWGMFIQLINPSTTDNINQITAEAMMRNYPLLSVLILGIIGPICEELTYRTGLFSLTKRINTVLAYFVTIFVFAFIHFDFESIKFAFEGDSSVLVNELLNLPSYLFAGATFSFLYDKLGLAASLTAHTANNLLSIVLSLIPTIAK